MNMDTKYLKAEERRLDFVNKFAIAKIKDIAIDDYVIGKQSKDSFCYRIENELKALGDIHGATAKKFGIYFNRKMGRYDSPKKFDQGEDTFENIKSLIIGLLEDGEGYNLEGIERNPLSNMFKGKILSTYFPEKFLCIFSNEYLMFFLDSLKIGYDPKISEVYKRNLLLEFKNKDKEMKNWTVAEFSKYLHNKFGTPKSNIKK